MLVSTDWVEQHLKDPSVRLIESNEDTLLYPAGHIPGAVHVDWTSDLNDQIRRDYITRDGFEQLMSRIGATKDTTVVFYGDKNNWWACYAFWVFQLFGHTNAKVMDGGRVKWQKENRPLTRDVPTYPATKYSAEDRSDKRHRAFRDEVMAHVESKGQLVDVRSPEEYAGTRMHMPDYPNEGALRGGHIPGAKSIPWAKAINPKTARSRPPTSCGSCTATTTSSSRSRRRSPTAASANAAATRGSRCSTCSASRTSATTTARGPNGATWSTCRLRSELRYVRRA